MTWESDLEIGSIYQGGKWDHDDNPYTPEVMAVFKSIDGENNWDRIALTSTEGNVYCVEVDPSDSNVFYVGGKYKNSNGDYVSGLFRLMNRGTVITEIGSSLIGNVNVICVDPFDHNKIYVGTNQNLYVSHNMGTSWQQLVSQCDVKCLIVDPLIPGRLFYATANGVNMSENGGMNWTPINEGLFNIEINCMDLDPINQVLYVGTNNDGIFRSGLIDDVPEYDEQISLPTSISLFPNYPNPFNLSTTIEYDLPSNGHVRLAIYDLLGCKIRTLIHRQQPAGHFQTTWDGSDENNLLVAAGIYFCRLEAGEYVKVVKLLLVK